MFDVSSVTKRYFDIKMKDLVLQLEAPSLSTMKKILYLTREINESAMEDLEEAVGIILNKNTAKYEISKEMINDELDFDQLKAIVLRFLQWVLTNKQSPN
ncbi:hypothetical protein [Clostridium pasteurianum]|uniref:Uncharacterized protein n=1 Tax=Clostridium pasteurianum BC1 TaxID=86416 RepID=R4K4D6_CLOPA|nr:hypothetical protein [Clostridium pasteurianum]AGK95409.1 hypothetical protein Clopa_0347 [Clostridium pasteurianum BC1]